MENNFNYLKEDEVGFIRIMLGYRDSGNTYDRAFGLITSIIDKDRYFNELMDFTNDFINQEHEMVIENLDFHK